MTCDQKLLDKNRDRLEFSGVNPPNYESKVPCPKFPILGLKSQVPSCKSKNQEPPTKVTAVRDGCVAGELVSGARGRELG